MTATRLRLALPLLALSLLCLCQPARAGHWAVTYEYSGQTSISYVPYYTGVPEPDPPYNDYLFGGSWPVDMDVSPDFDGQILPNTVSMSGSVTPVLTWTPDSRTDTSAPPKTIYVLATAAASASNAECWGVDTSGSAQADDGFGDPVTNPNPAVESAAYCSGQHLLTVDNSGGSRVVRLSAKSLSASYTPGGPANICDAQCYCAVAQDTRAVTISRDDALVRGETIDPDGTKHGDTLYSYMDYSATWNPSVINWQTFLPNFIGNWSMKTINVPFEQGGTEQIPNVNWSWSPNESEDTETFGKWSMPYGNWFITGDGAWMYQPSGSPKQATLTYTATDLKDNAQATAKYVMSFHDPYENWARNGAAVQGQDRPLSDPSASYSPESTPPTQEYNLTADSYDIADLVKAGGMVVSTAAPAAVVLTDAATDGVGGIAVGGLLNAAGYAAGTYSVGATSAATVNTSEGQFVKDANDQVRISNGTGKHVSGLPDVFVLSANRFTDTHLASLIANAPPSIQSEFWGGTIDTAAIASGYPAGTFTVSSTVYQETTIQGWAADWYDVHGAMLQADGVTRQKKMASTTIGGTPIAVNTWVFTASALPNTPNP